MSKTFLFKEMRQNERGEYFEVETKIQSESLSALIRYLKSNPKIIWKKNFTIKEIKEIKND